VNAAERPLVRLVGLLESEDFDPIAVERAARDLEAGLSQLSPATPRAERERILALHAALRAAVERRSVEAARSLALVAGARERLGRLTRPEDARAALDLRA
jgi:hypothetical protein